MHEVIACRWSLRREGRRRQNRAMATLENRPNTALLVIDVQTGVVEGAHERDAVVANISSLVAKARQEEIPVVWVQHNDGGLARDSDEWQIVVELDPSDSEPLIHKSYGDSFEDTALEDTLAGLGVGSLIVVGAQTDACIRSTLHGAFARGYDAKLVSDAHTTEDQTQWGAPPPDAGDRAHESLLDAPERSREDRRHGRDEGRRLLVMREVRAGIWHWEAHHPEWGETVSSYAIDDGERLLLFDPLSVPAEIVTLAANRETAIVLTCPWHRRDALDLADQLGVDVHVPPPDGGDPSPVPGRIFRTGAQLPIGVQAFPGMESNDLVLWVECRGALVVGDTLIDRGAGLEFPHDWAEGKPLGAAEILASLQTLLALPVEVVLPTHGPPTDRAGLERAISRRRRRACGRAGR